ncbi:asparagine synthase-related protein, partial [Oharaeibacter diazotrophicus]
MRLICGLLRLDGGPASPTTVAAMAAAMTAPGLAPRLAVRCDGPVGLGVLAFSRAHAAAVVADGALLLAADARLDDAGEAPEAILARAIGTAGPDFPDRVDGDFAVAAWDGARRRLLLGRDAFGVRPLAYALRSGRWFAFASLPKGLHGAGLAAADYDPAELAALFLQVYHRGAATGFREIRMLPAGCSLSIAADDGVPRLCRAFAPDPATVGRWRGSADEAAETLRILADAAVRARLPATGPAAAHLSGGLDSSPVAVLAARALRERGDRLLALSWSSPLTPDRPGRDEAAMAAAVLAAEPGMIHRDFPYGLPLPDRGFDPDWPTDPIHAHLDLSTAAAAAFGAGVVLSGVGGDQAASYDGRHPYLALLTAGRIGRLVRELPARAEADGVGLARAIHGRLLRPALFGRDGGARRQALTAERARFLVPALRAVAPDLALPRQLDGFRPEDRVGAVLDNHLPSRCTEMAFAGARHGVAFAFPLLDRRLVEFALGLPLHLMVDEGLARQPWRRAMRGVLPEAVRLSPHKLGGSDPRHVRLAAHAPALIAEAAALKRHDAATAIVDLD